MMCYSKSAVKAVLVVLFSVCATKVCAGQSTAYERIVEILSNKKLHAENGQYLPLDWNLSILCSDTATPPPDSARYVLWSIVIDENFESSLRRKSVGALHWFKDTSIQDSLRARLQNPVLQSSIAALFVKWGMWDEGYPYLAKGSGYDLLAYYEPEKARPVIEAGIKDPSPRNRAYAASAMAQFYGDESHARRIAIENIQLYDHHGMVWQDDEETLRLLDGAYWSLLRYLSDDDLWLYVKGTESRFSLIRGDSVQGIARLALRGNVQARYHLEQMADSSKFADVKERCGMALNRIRSRE